MVGQLWTCREGCKFSDENLWVLIKSTWACFNLELQDVCCLPERSPKKSLCSIQSWTFMFFRTTPSYSPLKNITQGFWRKSTAFAPPKTSRYSFSANLLRKLRGGARNPFLARKLRTGMIYIWKPIKQTGVTYREITLPETNTSPLKIDGWKTILSFWDTLFSVANCQF